MWSRKVGGDNDEDEETARLTPMSLPPDASGADESHSGYRTGGSLPGPVPSISGPVDSSLRSSGKLSSSLFSSRPRSA
ncbi:hypothetical protein EYF80_045414 [Liparis tanakae]|uniref:Uncharacterized protein n=1 Tax=Liparis tanakae TaxID=230148 RepID=A0A4Z2FT17_9TELE|nr:hypothetical protein EYF80_045414 [Liparis tanakae]